MDVFLPRSITITGPRHETYVVDEDDEPYERNGRGDFIVPRGVTTANGLKDDVKWIGDGKIKVEVVSGNKIKISLTEESSESSPEESSSPDCPDDPAGGDGVTPDDPWDWYDDGGVDPDGWGDGGGGCPDCT